MSNEKMMQEVNYTHVILEGTAYEVGKLQGELLREHSPQYARFLTSSAKGCKNNAEESARLLKYFDRYCPGINEEVEGFAASLGVEPIEAAYYAMSASLTGQCSHVALLPGITQDGHVLMGRSYEWSDEDEFRLVTTRIKGKASHIGFSIFQFGRFDGLNEHGLGVTMSAAVPGSQPQNEGLKFWAVLRTLLDSCKTVDEALKLIDGMPMSFNWNLIVADRTGEAALVEIACQNRAIKRINKGTADQYVSATNQYTLPEMLKYDTNRMRHSVDRYHAIRRAVEASAPQVSCETIRRVLSAKTPEGLCCHFYKDWLGTLWSMIFDLTAGTVEICFGSPQVNPWRSFDLTGTPGVTTYKAVLPNEEAAEPQVFYGRMQPGEGI
ncbi:MAG: acyl-CoA--6-aminopenicillanic acid acyltransferase [Thermoclostridium sp.]|nr:acyl-CoA--6-aminopenicillanic acid acyltransferase [Thermoclostridium sp.]